MGGQNTGHCGSMVGLQNHHPQQQQQQQQQPQQQQQMVAGNIGPDHQQQQQQQQQQPLMMGGAMQGNMTMVPVGAKMDGTSMGHVNMMGIPGGTVGVANPMCGNMPVGAPAVPAAADNKNFIPLVVPFGWRRVVNGGQVVYIR
ncbi:TATA-box-binding protein-like [Scylla paramamosain]|uniref:TATA-box-binding protein-like n=1 Tax=Scylla paramamosain TaxID=85552 RepID=UPI0030838E77